MMHTLNGFMSWFISNPRRTFAVLFVIMMLLIALSLVVPDGAALAGSISSGS